MNKKVLIDKQALIDELMKIPGVGSNSDALKTIKRFPSYEPHKPVVPKFVAEWFEDNKDDLEFAIWELCVDSYGSDKQGMLNWIRQPENNSIETLIRMKDGYEVEKEPLYRVKIGEGYFVEYQGRGALIMPDCNKEIKIFDSKSDAERTAQTIGGTVEEEKEK
ncbi:DUF1642 domain-containing protein [Enterococcus lactis]|uniref:DUF1642 domain-containing protein n=1 Tax=Enterococcus lactis TaxID=357441 RepID=UPI001C7D51A8|nr:DUF1642 domain-containing protein [Enterococcus lactis]MBX4255588.1 DUF1642 domain-containing protein [Enterococcus lactis]